MANFKANLKANVMANNLSRLLGGLHPALVCRGCQRRDSPRQAPYRTRLMLETLEDRRLLAMDCMPAAVDGHLSPTELVSNPLGSSATSSLLASPASLVAGEGESSPIFQQMAAGVTVISHGWQLQFGPSEAPPDWTLEMGRAIGARVNNEANIFMHDADPDSASFGQWRPLTDNWTNTDDAADELVLVYDWQWESNDGEDGWIQGAADNLFASIRNAPLGIGENVFDRPIHFIGHSRGAVLNTLAVERIGSFYPDVMVDQVTSLDPHPIAAGGVAGIVYETDDPEMATFDNVAFADNYFRRDPPYQLDLDFDGVEVPGAWDLELNEDILAVGGSSFEHLDVHRWYLATIDVQSNVIIGETITQFMADNWWTSGTAYSHEPQLNLEENSGRSNVGFARSRLGQLDRSRMAVSTGQAVANNPIVFNGDFEFGDATFNEIPGWERHGGLQDGDLAAGRLHLGESGVANHTRATHNPLFIPANAKFLQFDYEVTDASSDDVLEVRLGDTLLATLSLENEGQQVTQPIWVADFANSVDTIDLQLNHGLLIGSDVHVDNLMIHASDQAWRNPIDFADVNANGGVNVLDAFLVIGELRDRGVNAQLPPEGPGQGEGPFVDANGNDRVDLVDAFSVIDRVRDSLASAQGPGEGEHLTGPSSIYAAPEIFAATEIFAARGISNPVDNHSGKFALTNSAFESAESVQSVQAGQGWKRGRPPLWALRAKLPNPSSRSAYDKVSDSLFAQAEDFWQEPAESFVLNLLTRMGALDGKSEVAR